MFGLDFDELGVKLAVGAHLRQELDNLGLRRDRVGGDDLRAGQHGAVGQRVVPHDDFLHFRSSTMTMHFDGHSSAQMPQPLQ